MNSSSVKLTEANYYRNGGIRTTYWETFDIDALWYYLFIEKIALKNSSNLLHECHKIKEKLIELTSWRHILFLFVLFLNRIISQVAKWIFIYGPFELEFFSKLNYGYLFNMFCSSYGGVLFWISLLGGDSNWCELCRVIVLSNADQIWKFVFEFVKTGSPFQSLVKL